MKAREMEILAKLVILVGNMAAYSKEEKIKIVEFYFATKSVTQTQRNFRRHFKARTAPCRNTVLSLTEKFIREGSVGNLWEGSTGTSRSARTEEMIMKAKDIIERNPRAPVRHLSQQVGVSLSSARRILREDLGLYPYKIWTRQKLTPKNMMDRVAFCKWFMRKCRASDAFLHSVWFTDEAHFHLDGRINTRNNRFWGTEPPDMVEERPLHSLKCTAWCAVSCSGVIGPFWFEDRVGRTQTVSAERYRRVFEQFLEVMQRRCADNYATQWYQQDGATPHTARATIQLIKESFGERVISRNTPHPWPANSPDLNPLDFFLWGHLKAEVYKGKPETLSQLKRAVTTAVRALSVNTCRQAVENLRRRAEVCVARNGRHLEHVL